MYIFGNNNKVLKDVPKRFKMGKGLEKLLIQSLRGVLHSLGGFFILVVLCHNFLNNAR